MNKTQHSNSLINKVAAEFCQELQVRKYSPCSIASYRHSLEDFISTVGKDDPRAITSADLELYRTRLVERGWKVSSILTYFQAVKLFTRYLEERQLIFTDPTAGLPVLHKPNIMQPVPSEEEMRIVLEQPDTRKPLGLRDRAWLETVYSTGVRRRELLDMTVPAVDLAAGKVRVMGKGQRERVVPLGQSAVHWLRKYLEEVRSKLATPASGDILWIGNGGQPLSYGMVDVLLGAYCRKAGIVHRIGLHAIRRACVTHMLHRGASPVTLQLLLGHTDLTHLSQYLKVAISDLKAIHAQSRVGQ